jgi:hypothetical protein
MATSQPLEGHPAVAYALAEADPMYARGRRFRLDQLDGGQYWFVTKDAMNEFVQIHDFRYVKEEEMMKMRAAYDEPTD